ncbi:ATP-grasp domain-containing protein [Lysinimonas soli]|uniref:ATP-grasp domain-containing protein n=1 Tax=Lysinimonas soli TaxID=1074233 RepID=A0ABW0NJP2_9MICO
MTGAQRERDLPLLGVVYEGLEREDPPLLFAEAAEGVCRLLWVLPHRDEAGRATHRFLRGLGTVVDVSGLTVAEAASAVREHAPEGIVCFNDGNLVWTAGIAERLGLRFFSVSTAERLTDKLLQRTALRDGGLPTPEFWNLDDIVADPSSAGSLGTASYPLVMKPRTGRGAIDTLAIGSLDELTAAMTDITQGRMLLERYIPDPTTPITGAGSAPFVSVELVMSDGLVSVLGVTGKPPLAPPFRETGHLFPADVPPDVEEHLIEAAVGAARALGVETGVLHVEVKCTDAGPVIIEVNGCMGGGAIRGLILRSLAIDEIQVTMRLALGEHVVYRSVPRPADVGFRFDIQPDAAFRRITAVEGLETVPDIPGVERVFRGVGPGDEVSWRTGRQGFVAAILGAAPDHASARRIRDEFFARVVVSGTP